ncbi:hypothetical protein [Lysobacter sp. CA199]|uniref:hypothetical protein n=1 Tax=Lysobacter sp. CA199 TaxID=3455608 RepID=UPI003F8D0A09
MRDKRFYRWLALIALVVSLCGVAQAGRSETIPADVRIDPILIEAAYLYGICGHHSMGAPRERPAPDRPPSSAYLVCRTLPTVLRDELKRRGFDIELVEAPGSIDDKDYPDNASAFWRATQSAAEYNNRYLLSYNGYLLSRSGPSEITLSLYAPGDRASLGEVTLEKAHITTTQVMGYVQQIQLKSVEDIATIVANTLEARCAKKGLFDFCPERARIKPPRK